MSKIKLMLRKILACVGIFVSLFTELSLCISYGKVGATIAAKYKLSLLRGIPVLLCALGATFVTCFVCYHICERFRKLFVNK